MKPTVLIATTTCWIPTARLAMALAAAGFAVDVVCPSRHPVANTHCTRHNYRYSGLRPVSSFASAIDDCRPDLIVPGDDLATRHLHQIYENSLHAPGSKVAALIERSLGSAANFPVVFDRSAFIDLAREEGVRSPRTEVIADPEHLKKWASAVGFPYVLKANETSGGDGVRIVHTLEQAEAAFRKLTAPPVLARALKRTLVDQDSALLWPSLARRQAIVNAQAFAPGSEATSAVACWNGTVLASLHVAVMKKAKSAGHATVVRRIENEEMSIAAELLVRRLNLSGLHGFDFMLEEHSGKAHLIEINPRATQIGHFTLGPGRDLPAALLAAVTSQPLKPAPRITGNDMIALFPQEWIRDADSPYLKTAYHDVPWSEPELVRACVLNRRKQTAWYSETPEVDPAAEMQLSEYDHPKSTTV